MHDFKHVVDAVDSHTAGEPTRIITGGLPTIEGETMLARREWLRQNLDHLRTGLVLEPRGHEAIILAYLTPPVSAEAHAGVIFANDVGYLNMCGHGTIGVATVLVRSGEVEAVAPETRIMLDTPPGQVEALVEVENGLPTAVRVRNVPSFLHQRDLVVEVPGHGPVTLDVSYGGNWFGILDAGQVGLAVEMQNLRALLDFADRVRSALAAAGIAGFDPQTGMEQPIDHIEIYTERSVPDGVGARTLTLCPGMAYDRSPCGTGTSAKLASLHARGKLGVGEAFHNRSIVGTDFVGTVLEAADLDGRPSVLPQVRGSAYITGFQKFVFDEDDSLAYGLRGEQ